MHDDGEKGILKSEGQETGRGNASVSWNGVAKADSRHPFEVYCSPHEGYVCGHRVRIGDGKGDYAVHGVTVYGVVLITGRRPLRRQQNKTRAKSPAAGLRLHDFLVFSVADMWPICRSNLWHVSSIRAIYRPWPFQTLAIPQESFYTFPFPPRGTPRSALH